MKYKYLLLILTFFLSSESENHDCEQPSASVDFQVNNCQVKIRSGERIFNDLESSNHGYETPVGSGAHSVYALNTWIGGIIGFMQLKLAGGTFGINGSDFISGPLTVDGNATTTPEIYD